MDTSKYIAGLMGPPLALVGIGFLLNPSILPGMTEQLANAYALIFISGVLTIVGGLAIVRAHNIWEASWRTIITVFGWMSVLAGAARITIPDVLAKFASSIVFAEGAVMAGAIVSLALGAFLTFKGYMSAD
jgi:hypothetical protein